MKRPKVCWISNAPSPYKVAFMKELAKRIDLVCIFEGKKENEHERDASWYDYESNGFEVVYLDDGNAKQMIKEAAKSCDCLINSDYSKPICMYAVHQFHKQHKKSVLHADGGLAIPRGFVDRVIGYVMRKNDYFLSSGKMTDAYFQYYGVQEKQLLHYHFACMSEEEFNEHQELRKQKTQIRKDLGIKAGMMFVSVGQQIPRKGYDVLVKAMKDVPSTVELYIIGGVAEDVNVEYLRKHNLENVHFIPFLTKEELNRYYASADAFVLPTRYDIWGLVVNEAMSFGLPILTTDHCVAGVEFINRYKNGRIVPIEDEVALAKVMGEWATDSTSVLQYGLKSLEGIQNYTYETMADDFMNAIHTVMEQDG